MVPESTEDEAAAVAGYRVADFGAGADGVEAGELVYGLLGEGVGFAGAEGVPGAEDGFVGFVEGDWGEGF